MLEFKFCGCCFWLLFYEHCSHYLKINCLQVFPTRRSSKSRREEDKEYREPSARYFLLIVGMVRHAYSDLCSIGLRKEGKGRVVVYRGSFQAKR